MFGYQKAQDAALENFRAASDVFDAAKNLVTPFSSHAAAQYELQQAQHEVTSSPGDPSSAQERYSKALADCTDRTPYTRKLLGEHVAKMESLTHAFLALIDSFKRAAAIGADNSHVREILDIETKLYRLDADALDSGARVAGKAALQEKIDALRASLDHIVRHGLSDENDARLKSTEKHCEAFEGEANEAIRIAEKYIEIADSTTALVSHRSEVSPRSTAEVNRYVTRDTIGTLIGLAVYVGLVVWLSSTRAPGLAVALFWIGVVVAGLRATQMALMLVTSVVLFFARLSGWKPAGDDPNTLVASIVRLMEFSVLLYAMFFIAARIYPHWRFFGLS